MFLFYSGFDNTLPWPGQVYGRVHTVELTIPTIEEYRIVNFILCSDGEVQVLAPQRLEQLVEEKVDKLSRSYQKVQPNP